MMQSLQSAALCTVSARRYASCPENKENSLKWSNSKKTISDVLASEVLARLIEWVGTEKMVGILHILTSIHSFSEIFI